MSAPPITSYFSPQNSSWLPEDERNSNIFTVRLTEPLDPSAALSFQCCQEKLHQDWIYCNQKIIKFMCFHELNKFKNSHYHYRIVTSYKTRKSLLDSLKCWFQTDKLKKLSGNRIWSTHECYINGRVIDKSLLHSKYYVAKEGDIVDYKGYKRETIQKIIDDSYEYNMKLKLPVFKKIILQFKLDLERIHLIGDSIIKYYKSIEKIPPSFHICKELARKILYTIDPDYRVKFGNMLDDFVTEQKSIANFIFKKNPPLDQNPHPLPDWHSENIHKKIEDSVVKNTKFISTRNKIIKRKCPYCISNPSTNCIKCSYGDY